MLVTLKTSLRWPTLFLDASWVRNRVISSDVSRSLPRVGVECLTLKWGMPNTATLDRAFFTNSRHKRNRHIRRFDSGGKDKNLKDLRHQLPNIEKGTALTKAVLQIGWLPPKRA
ncbi:hypothetical protein NDU88_004062 [Pleurodeles waltl]|uniref:Uncharacterized protein n=1 Tax=Pleurodeles waltl TaxID=8319 RepID=A0AAV7LKB6_PLEWA|nr:hypothetical protein NDU88_004062 [Pleurodeles waltl]